MTDSITAREIAKTPLTEAQQDQLKLICPPVAEGTIKNAITSAENEWRLKGAGIGGVVGGVVGGALARNWKSAGYAALIGASGGIYLGARWGKISGHKEGEKLVAQGVLQADPICVSDASYHFKKLNYVQVQSAGSDAFHKAKVEEAQKAVDAMLVPNVKPAGTQQRQ